MGKGGRRKGEGGRKGEGESGKGYLIITASVEWGVFLGMVCRQVVRDWSPSSMKEG